MKTFLSLVCAAVFLAACSSPLDVDTDRRTVDITPHEPPDGALPATRLEVNLSNSTSGSYHHTITKIDPQPANVTVDVDAFPAVLNLVFDISASDIPLAPISHIGRIYLRANALEADVVMVKLDGDPGTNRGVKIWGQTPKSPPASGYEPFEMSTVNSDLIVQIDTCKHDRSQRQFIIFMTIKLPASQIPDGPISYTGTVWVNY